MIYQDKTSLPKYKSMRFGAINYGEVFVSDKCPYMRLVYSSAVQVCSSTEYQVRNAVNLENGVLTYFPNDCEVYVVRNQLLTYNLVPCDEDSEDT